MYKCWYLDRKPVSYRRNLCQESSFQSKKNQKTAKVKFNKRTDFHWFKSCLFACLNCFYELTLWYPSQTTACFVLVFFSYNVLKLSWIAMWEVIFNLTIFYWEDLGVTFTSKLTRLDNVFQSFKSYYSHVRM